MAMKSMLFAAGFVVSLAQPKCIPICHSTRCEGLCNDAYPCCAGLFCDARGYCRDHPTPNPPTPAGCTGSKDPSGPYPSCYEGSAGALGLKEDVQVKISSFASGKGTMDLQASGIEKITCKGKSFTKSGQDISPEISDCLPKVITVQKVEYCSDDDTVSVTVKDTHVPIPVSATLKKVACASTVVV